MPASPARSANDSNNQAALNGNLDGTSDDGAAGDGTSGDRPTAIRIRGCRVHNLKNIDIDVPHGELIVVCGLSGSGKTSLALDTMYAEGQRQYIESFSAYTRQYLDRIDRPDCDSITGIPAAIAVTRAGGVRTNRSTVATTTEIADHVRLMYAKASTLVCHGCGQVVAPDDPARVADQLHALNREIRLMIGFDVHLPGKVEAAEILLALQQDGYLRLVVDGETFDLSDADRKRLAGKVRRGGTDIVVIIDRLSGGESLSRLTESLETALVEGAGRAVIHIAHDDTASGTGDPSRDPSHDPSGDAPKSRYPIETIDSRPYQRRLISLDRRCDACDLDFPDPVPRLFNFNNPTGACPTCEGFGDVNDIDAELVVPDPTLSIADGAIAPWNTPAYAHERVELMAIAKHHKLPVDVPYKDLTAKHRELIWRGDRKRKFGGLDGFFKWLQRKQYKMHVRVFASRWRSYRPCPTCEGRRLKPEALAYKIDGRSIAEFLVQTADEARRWAEQTREKPEAAFEDDRAVIAAGPLFQIERRCGFLCDVGLGYLQLTRPLRTLSGGETQRVSLTGALGSALTGMLYVLDEPTAALHPSDVDKLIDRIVDLRNRGNTVVVIEHNERVMRLADRIIEIGPGAGTHGGEVTFEGAVDAMMADRSSITGDFLSGRRGGTLAAGGTRKPSGFIEIDGARGHNLKNVDVKIPLGVRCVVTGVSGSGKSTLIQDTVFPAVASRVTDRIVRGLPFKAIRGLGGIDDCLLVDQSPISRSARSIPATYVKAFDPIRKVFAGTVDARTRNLTPGHFSFNSDKGRCEQCEGSGIVEIDMQFLADVSIVCPTCRGRRYRDEILAVTYRDRSIADVLAMTATEAIGFFRGQDAVGRRLQTLVDVGLDYVGLGQSVTTLSSGEGQRLKLAAFLASARRRRTLFVMDEPTTGLHAADIVRLIDCLDALIDDGHSLLIVEHNPMMIRGADWIIDVGPGAGVEGGKVVATGPPSKIKRSRTSVTAKFL